MEFARKLLVVMTTAALLLSLAMSILSAWIRLADSGLDCTPWPACYGAAVVVDAEPGLTVGPTDTNPGLRVAHRFMASAFGILAVLLTTAALWYRRTIPASPVWPVLILLVTVLLAIIGLESPAIDRPIITTINLLGGMVLAVVLLHWLLALRTPVRQMPPEALASVIALGLALVVTANGGWVSANFAAGSCDGVFSCQLSDNANVFAAFDPGRQLEIAAGKIVLDADTAAILFVHQASGPLLAFALIFASVVAIAARGYRHHLLLAPGLLGVLVLLIAIEGGRPSPLTALLHNGVSLALLLTLVWQIHYLRRP